MRISTIRQTRRRLLAFVLANLLAFCAPLAFAVNSVFVQSTLDYNAILISNVDIVFVYEQEALDAFPASKSDWIGNKMEYLEQYSGAVELVSVFIPQGFDSEMASLPERRDQALAVYVYAQHDASGAKPVDISGMENVLVQIDQFGILVSAR